VDESGCNADGSLVATIRGGQPQADKVHPQGLEVREGLTGAAGNGQNGNLSNQHPIELQLTRISYQTF
jgi:hypothetical protein